MKFIIVFLSILFFSNKLYSQKQQEMYFKKKRHKREAINFDFEHNLIFIPLKINNSDTLRFIVDTGVRTTLISNLHFDTLSLNYARKIRLYGLGKGISLEAYHSEDNEIQVGNKILGKNQRLNVLMKDIFHLSEKLGVNIHGLIGLSLFKDFIVEVNYKTHRLRFNNPEKFKYKRRHKKAVQIPMKIHRGKPYIYVKVQQENDSIIPVKMLMDLGGSHGVWLNVNSHPKLFLPKVTTDAYLGRGLGGDIHGNLGRVKKLIIGKHELNMPIVAYPDSASAKMAFSDGGRNGSLGGEVFRRFHLVVDYPNKLVTFIPNNNFKQSFDDNMSGIDFSMPYINLPIFVINYIRKNSPADLVGIKEGDQILEINNRKVKEYSAGEIVYLFKSREGKKIKITINREGEEKKFVFRLKRII